jgi:hypothetical protein
MFNLTDPNISYILISPENKYGSQLDNKLSCERACSILYSKDYTVLSVTGHYEGQYEKSFLSIPSEESNDDLRKDLIYLLEYFNQECGIVKYKNDKNATKVFRDGSEKPMSLVIYNSDLNNKTYLYNGISFSFVEEKRYYFPKKREELKNGMVLEYFNNNNWVQKEVVDINQEYDNLFKLLMKYEKVRIQIV